MRISTTMTLLYVLAFFGGLALALEDVPSSATHQQRPSLLIGLRLAGPREKRAYSYVSEYKRLPIYNFGLGKRWSGPNLEDTSKDKRMRLYSFGLGKRSDLFDTRPWRVSPGYVPEDSYYSYPLDDYFTDKRSNHRMYSFGLGKRPSNDNTGQRFLFGLGKRTNEEDEVEDEEKVEEEEDANA